MMAARQPEWGHCHWLSLRLHETTWPPLRAWPCAHRLCDREGRNRALKMERKIITPLIPSNTHWYTIYVYCILERLLSVKQLGPEATATSNVHPLLKWRGKSASAQDECRNSVTVHTAAIRAICAYYDNGEGERLRNCRLNLTHFSAWKHLKSTWN